MCHSSSFDLHGLCSCNPIENSLNVLTVHRAQQLARICVKVHTCLTPTDTHPTAAAQQCHRCHTSSLSPSAESQLPTCEIAATPAAAAASAEFHSLCARLCGVPHLYSYILELGFRWRIGALRPCFCFAAASGSSCLCGARAHCALLPSYVLDLSLRRHAVAPAALPPHRWRRPTRQDLAALPPPSLLSVTSGHPQIRPRPACHRCAGLPVPPLFAPLRARRRLTAVPLLHILELVLCRLVAALQVRRCAAAAESGLGGSRSLQHLLQ